MAIAQSIPGKVLPFAAVREQIAEQLRARVEERAMRQYISILVGQALVVRVDLQGAVTPPLQ